MSPSARKILIALSTSLLLGLLTACSKQGEGERCDSYKAGHSDCEEGLVCTNLNSSTAQPNDDAQPQLERCCPPMGATSSDDRCNPITPQPSGTAGSSSSGSGGASDGGMGGADTETTVAGSGGEPTTAGTSGSGGDTNTSTGGTDAASGAGGA